MTANRYQMQKMLEGKSKFPPSAEFYLRPPAGLTGPILFPQNAKAAGSHRVADSRATAHLYGASGLPPLPQAAPTKPSVPGVSSQPFHPFDNSGRQTPAAVIVEVPAWPMSHSKSQADGRELAASPRQVYPPTRFLQAGSMGVAQLRNLQKARMLRLIEWGYWLKPLYRLLAPQDLKSWAGFVAGRWTPQQDPTADIIDRYGPGAFMLPDLGEGQRTLRQKYLGRGTLGWTWAPRVVWQKPELPFAAIKASETTPLKPYTPSEKFPAVQSGFDAGGPLVQPPSSSQMTPSVRGPLLPGPTAQRPPRPWRPDDLTYEVCRPHSPVWAMVKTLVAYRSGWSTWASEMLFNLYYLSRIPLDAKAYGGTRPLWQWRIYRAYAEGMINHFNHVARLHRTHGAPRLLSLMRWVPPLFVWSFQRAYNRLAAQVSFKS